MLYSQNTTAKQNLGLTFNENNLFNIYFMSVIILCTYMYFAISIWIIFTFIAYSCLLIA